GRPRPQAPDGLVVVGRVVLGRRAWGVRSCRCRVGPRAPGPPGPRAPGPSRPRVGLDGLVLGRRTGWWWSALVSSRRGPADPGRVSAGGVRRSGRGGEGPGPSGLAGRGRGRRGRFCGLDAAAPAALEEGPGAAGARG